MYSQDGEEQSGPRWRGGNKAQVARSPADAAAQLRAATKALAAFNNSRPRGKSPVQMAAVMEEDDDEVAAPAPGRPLPPPPLLARDCHTGNAHAPSECRIHGQHRLPVSL